MGSFGDIFLDILRNTFCFYNSWISWNLCLCAFQLFAINFICKIPPYFYPYIFIGRIKPWVHQHTQAHTHTALAIYSIYIYIYIYRTTPTIERAAILCVPSVSISMGYLSTSVSVNCRLGNILMLLNYTSTWLDLVHQHIKGIILQRHIICHVWHYFIRKHCFLGIRNSIVFGISVSWQKTS